MHWRWTPTPEELLLAQGERRAETAAAVAGGRGPGSNARRRLRHRAGALLHRRRLQNAAKGEPAAPAVSREAGRVARVSAAPIATASSATFESTPIGPRHRRCRCGAGRSARAGRRSRFAATCSIRKSSAATMRSSRAYRVSTGEPVWRHRDPVRFYESNGGAGPRATPTIHKDRVYAHGATGMLNALDAHTGKVIWSHNTSTDTSREVPMWGISSSPLVIDDVVIVSALRHARRL